MKKLNVFLVSVFAVAALNAAVIEQVIVRQQWPWSTDVKIEYTLQHGDVVKPVDVKVEAFNGSEKLDQEKLESALVGDRYGVTDAVGTIVLDPVKAFGTTKVALANFKVKLSLSGSAENIHEVIYKIIDIDASPMTVTDVTRADIFSGKYGTYETEFSKIGPDFQTSLTDVLIWTGVTNGDLYRTSKIALRKIPAAGKSYMMGPSDSAQVEVSFTNDFWIGVFELTQYQVRKLRADYEPWITAEGSPDTRAADYLAWGRGAYPKYDLRNGAWPAANHASASPASMIGLLQAALGTTRLDLPTDAQWEFAARAGTTTPLYSGKTGVSANIREIARMRSINCGNPATQPGHEDNLPSYIEAGYPLRTDPDLLYGANKPGMYRPNAYGLYDMMGNVREWVLNRYAKGEQLVGGVEPKGSAIPAGEDPSRSYRGGSYAEQCSDVGNLSGQTNWVRVQDAGARLCLHGED